MNKFGRILLLAILAMPVGALAQTIALLDAAQLDQITASVALYPDTVLGEILTASRHPDQVDLAAGWLDDPLNAGLQGDDLAAALQNQPWDNSVKALVPTPRLLFMLSDNDEWMHELGNAFAAQQGDVMDSVQRLRWQAYRGGTLQSNAEQAVGLQNGNYIVIQPPVPVATVFWPAPVWDWQHHRIDGHESMRHSETVQPQPQVQPQQHVAPATAEPQAPVVHSEQGRPVGLPVIQVAPQPVTGHATVHAQQPVESVRGVEARGMEENSHEQNGHEAEPTPPIGGKQP